MSLNGTHDSKLWDRASLVLFPTCSVSDYPMFSVKISAQILVCRTHGYINW